MRSSAPLASSPLSIVTALQRRPVSLRAIAVNTCVPIVLPGSRIVTGTSMRRIEHLAAAVRRRLVRVAPHVELLRRAADVDRDRLEREFCLARSLGQRRPCSSRLPWRCPLRPPRRRASISRRPWRCRAASQPRRPLARPSASALRPAPWPASVFAAASALSADASSASALFLSPSSLRSDAASDAASRAAVAAAFFASSAALTASAASRASASGRDGAAATASAFGMISAGWEISTGAVSFGEMITRMPIRVLSNTFSAKPNGIRMQPCEAA